MQRSTRLIPPRRPRHRLFIAGWGALAAVCLLATAGAGRAQSNTPDTKFWVPNGSVSAIAVTDSTVYLGGSFTWVGPNNGRGAPLDLSTAQPWPSYARPNGSVYACVADGAGGWYIGGDFTAVGGVTRNHLAHLLANGALDAVWSPDCSGYVSALAVANGTVYAGGSFRSVNGATPRNHLAAFNATDGTATVWNPDCDDQVCGLAVSGGRVYAGGWFGTVNGGTPRNHLAAFDTADGTATAWNPNCWGDVYALAVANGTVYAGGNFGAVDGGTARNSLAAFNTTDGTATDWNPDCDGNVQALAVVAGTVYAGGDFIAVNGGTSRNHLAAFNTTDGAATDWNPNCDEVVYALAVAAGTVYAGGWFTTVNNGRLRHGLAAFNTTDGAATDWNPYASSGVCALAISGQAIYAGGEFTSIGGVARNRLAALDRTTGLPTSWNPNCNAYVNGLALNGSILYAGGGFTKVNGGTTRNWLAAFNATDGTATAWNPNCGGAAYTGVSTVAVAAGVVYAGGNFNRVNGGTTRHGLAAFNTTDGTATAWNPNCGGDILALAVAAGVVYAGGEFSTVNGNVPRHNLAAFSTTDGTATAWNPNCNSVVRTLAVADGLIYAGGDFTVVNGATTRNSLAAFNATDGTATAWNPGCDDLVTALAVAGNSLRVGGFFRTVNGSPRYHLAALNTADGTVVRWDPVWRPQYPLEIAVHGDVFVGSAGLLGEPPFFAAFPQPGRDIALYGGMSEIANGDNTPAVADGTDWESVTPGATATHTFTIGNFGSMSLNLTGTPLVVIQALAGPGAFTVTQQPSSPVAAEGRTTFTIQFAPSALDTVAATVSIASDDGEKNPYTFAIHGLGNTLPVAADDGYATAADTAFTTGNVLANDADADGQALRVSGLDTAGILGTVTDNADGTFDYDPADQFDALSDGETATDSFRYTVSDSLGGTATATVTITVTGMNDAPVARNDSYAAKEDATLTVAAPGVLDNDTDAEGDSLTVEIVTNVAHGSLLLAADGSLTYVPTPDYCGSDSFTYRASDGDLASNLATVTLNVLAVNDAPSFVAGTAQAVSEDCGAQTVPGWATAISAGPADEAGQTLDFIVSNDNHALFSAPPAIAANGSLAFTPAANANGTAIVTVQLHDNGGVTNGGADTSAPQTLSITVTPVNDAPVAMDANMKVTKGKPRTFTLVGTDVEGQALTYRLVSLPVHGTAVLTGAGPEVIYTPAPGYTGRDDFTYQANDGALDSNTATVTLTVKKRNVLVAGGGVGGGGCALGVAGYPITRWPWLALLMLAGAAWRGLRPGLVVGRGVNGPPRTAGAAGGARPAADSRRSWPALAPRHRQAGLHGRPAYARTDPRPALDTRGKPG